MSKYKIKVKDKLELTSIIQNKKIPLDLLDVSAIDDMNYIFSHIEEINGCISNWDVSNVVYMNGMFLYSRFNCDLSKWNVSKVVSMKYMFQFSKIYCNISNWDVSNVKIMTDMFYGSKIDCDLSEWNIKSLETDFDSIFAGSKMSIPYTWKIKKSLY